MTIENLSNENENVNITPYLYFEEYALGEAYENCNFDKNNKFLCIVSKNVVVVFDVHSSERVQIFKHKNKLIGQTFYNEKLITYTKASELCIWNVKDGELIEQFVLEFPDDALPHWFYQVNGKHFLLTFDLVKAEWTLFQILFGDVVQKMSMSKGKNDQNEERKLIEVRKVATIEFDSSRPAQREHLAIGDGFYVKCNRKAVMMVKFGTGNENKYANVKLSKHNKFTLDSQFNVADQEFVQYDGVHISGDHLYASLNVGRICTWSNFIINGIVPSNMSFITLSGHRSIICIAKQGGSIYIGTGKCLLYKYNLTGTSGIGRWNRLEMLQLHAPPRALALSADSAMLSVILSDNSVIIFKTAGMKMVSKFEVLNTPQNLPLSYFRFGIFPDPLNAKLLITNGRFGHLQWINPFHWKTVKQLDISEENPPHEDTFNLPDMLWLNTYLICATQTGIVTCECRRNDTEKTYLKFWLRKTSSKFELEDCFTLQKRLDFVRSTMDDIINSDSNSCEQEFLCINSSGDMDAYIRDKERSGHWCRAFGRHWENWQRIKVKCCSRIRQQTFATVNTLNECCIWDFVKMRVLRVLENLQKPNQVEWSSVPGIFLIACQSGIVAFNHQADAFVWAIHSPTADHQLSIFTNRLCTFAYNEREVFIIDPENGVLKSDQLKFSRAQANIIPLEKNGNICFCGITQEGSLSMLKPTSMTEGDDEENKEKVITNEHDQTAFSRFKSNRIKKEEEEEMTTEMQQQPLLNYISIKKFVDGPAHSLAPIAQLANKFVESCLTRRKRE